MNPTIFLTTLRQRFSSRPRVVLVAIVFLVPIGLSMMAREIALQATQTGGVFAFLLAAGILGQESSSGVFQLLFARPVRRWEYVVSRWLAVCAAACGLVVLQIALICLVLASKGLPEARDIVFAIGTQMLSAIGTTSIVLLYSSFISGVGDVIGVILTAVSAQVIGGIGQLRQSEWLVRTGAELGRFVAPQLDAHMLTRTPLPWFDLTSYLSTIALCVAVAVLVLNRREISYASD